jgi:hypothetical protein
MQKMSIFEVLALSYSWILGLEVVVIAFETMFAIFSLQIGTLAFQKHVFIFFSN